MVLHRPQTLIPSSGSTTSVGPDGPSAAGTWCFTARKPLFLRSEAPRLSVWMGLRRLGRGAAPPANPYSFVRKHHVFRSGWAAGLNGTWCFTARISLFLRPEAPRLSVRRALRRRRRGASLPANPCSFVRRHHVCRSGWAFGGWDVVLHRPQTLIPSSGSTTSVGLDGMKWETARPFPFLSTHKERNSAGREARCCSFIIHIFGSSLFPRGLPFV